MSLQSTASSHSDGNGGVTGSAAAPARTAKSSQPLMNPDQLGAWAAALIECSADAVVGEDLDGMVRTWNGSAERLFGYPASEMIGQPIARIIPADRIEEEAEILRRPRPGDTVEPFETVRLRSNGQLVDVALTVSPIKDAMGAVIGVSSIARDVTEHRRTRARAEARVQESLVAAERAVKELADQKFALDQHAIVAVTDVQGTITYINDKFCEISKYSRQELLGHNHRILNSGHHPREFFQEMYRAIASGKVWQGEIKNRAKDRSYYWVDTTIVPIMTAAGKPRQYVAIRADITARKLAELALQKQTEELARSNRDLEQFAYAASHDLQEPLRAVTGCMQLFQARYGGKLDARADEFVNHAVNGAIRMQKLIDDLLAFSRVGTRGVELRPVQCATAVEDALKNLSLAVRENNAIVEYEGLPAVSGDLPQLALLFQNLIGNALKFHGPEAPRIRIGAQPEGREWVISVQDNGIGIEPQYFERIFVIFQRLHTRTEYPGTGMGLALCKRIIERHSGRIWVESEIGKGTAFRFTLRRAGVPEPPLS